MEGFVVLNDRNSIYTTELTSCLGIKMANNRDKTKTDFFWN